MPLVVSQPDDPKEFPTTSQETADGVTLTRTFLVTGTGDQLIARSATGIPVPGEQLGQTGLYVISRDAVRFGGWDRAGTQSSGACKVTVKYATPGLINWQAMPTGPESNYTEIDLAQRSVQMMWGWNFGAATTGNRNSGPINNGEGVGKEVGSLEAKVYAYTTLPNNIPFNRMIDLAAKGAINSDAIVLPKLKGNGPALSFAVGQVRYRGFQAPQWKTKDVYEVVHLLSFAPDWNVIWTETDLNGVPGPNRIAQIYERELLGGLW